MLRKILTWIVGWAVVYVLARATAGDREIAPYLDWAFQQGASGFGYGLSVVLAVIAAIGLGQSVICFVKGKPVLGTLTLMTAVVAIAYTAARDWQI